MRDVTPCGAHRASSLAAALSTQGEASEAYPGSDGTHRCLFRECSGILRDEVGTLAPCISTFLHVLCPRIRCTKLSLFTPCVYVSRHVRDIRARLGSGSMYGTPHEASTGSVAWNGVMSFSVRVCDE